MSEKIKIVIDRSKWRTGADGFWATGGKRDAALLDKDGYKCCLGFVASACGFTEDQILENSSPEDLLASLTDSSFNEQPVQQATDNLLGAECGSGLVYLEDYRDSGLADSAMWVNDDSATHPAYKEKQLLKLFADSRYELEFVGDYSFCYQHRRLVIGDFVEQARFQRKYLQEDSREIADRELGKLVLDFFCSQDGGALALLPDDLE